MAFLTGSDRTLAEAISRLAYCNPFLPERIECERAALGPAFVAGGTLWHATGEPDPMPNVAALGKLSEALAGRLAARRGPSALRGRGRLPAVQPLRGRALSAARRPPRGDRPRGLLPEIPPGRRALPADPAGHAAGRSRRAPPAGQLLPDPPGVPPHLPQHHW